MTSAMYFALIAIIYSMKNISSRVAAILAVVSIIISFVCSLLGV